MVINYKTKREASAGYICSIGICHVYKKKYIFKNAHTHNIQYDRSQLAAGVFLKESSK